MKNNAKLKQISKSIAIILAVIVAVIALQFGISKLVKMQKNEKAVSFNEYKIAVSEIELSTEEYTGEGVTVSIEIANDHFSDTISASEIMNSADLEIEYKLDGDSEWTKYVSPFEVTQRTNISTRFVTQDKSFEGPITVKPVLNIAVAKIGDVYYETLEDAINACPANAGNNQTKIEMIANTTESVTIPTGKNIILDLCGKTVTANETQVPGSDKPVGPNTISVDGIFNLIDSGDSVNPSSNEKGAISSTTGAGIKINDGGRFTLGTKETGEPQVSIEEPAINGGNYGIIVEEGGIFNFYDGVVSGTTLAITKDNGEAKVTDKPENYVVITSEESGKEVAILRKQNTVSFDSNGGTPSEIESIKVLQGKAYNQYGTWPENPTKEGYSFGGWKLNESIIEATTIVTQNQDHTLTAVWDTNSYSITYDLDNGVLPEGVTNPSTYTTETETFTLNNPSKTGYSFQGWKEANSNVVNNPEIITKGSIGDRIYTAIFVDDIDPNKEAPTGTPTTSTIKVTFNQTDDGSGIDPTTIEYGIKKDGQWIWESATSQDEEGTHTFTGLQSGTTYEIKTRAKDNDGNNVQNPVESNSANCTTIDLTIGNIYARKNTIDGENIDLLEEQNENATKYNTNMNLEVVPGPQGTTTAVVKGPNGAIVPVATIITNVTAGNKNQTIETQTGVYEITLSTKDDTNENNVVTKTYFVYFDKDNPTIAPTNTVTSNSISINAHASDIGSGVDTVTYHLVQGQNEEEIVVGGNTGIDYSNDVQFTGLQHNTDCEITITVVDKSGNTTTQTLTIKTNELVPAELSFKEAESDTTFIPSNTQSEDDVWINEDAKITLNALTGVNSTYVVKKVTDSEGTTYSENTTVETSNGEYVATVTTTDGTNSVSKEYYFNVDKTAPTGTTYAGKMIYTDPKFENGINELEVYDLNNTGNVVIAREEITDDSESSGWGIKVTSTSAVNPYNGGVFFWGDNGKNKEYITVLRAKIPENYTLMFRTNNIGTDGVQEWLTENEGTGKWENYVYRVKTGTENVATMTKCFAIDGQTPTPENPLIWYIDYATVFETTEITDSKYIITIGEDNESGITNYAQNNNNQGTPTYESFDSTVKIAKVSNEVTQNGPQYSYIKDKAGNETIVTTNINDLGYIITYDANGGVGTIESQTKLKGTQITLKNDDGITKTNYIFAGWAESKTATEPQFGKNAVFNEDRNLSLYAVWNEVVASSTIKEYEIIEGVKTLKSETTTLYPSIQQAIDAIGGNVGSGNEAIVTILKDNVRENVTIANGQDIIIDLNNKQWKNKKSTDETPNPDTIKNYGKLTITGQGTIIGDNNTNVISIQPTGDTTVLNGSIIGDNTAINVGEGTLTLGNLTDTVEIEGEQVLKVSTETPQITGTLIGIDNSNSNGTFNFYDGIITSAITKTILDDPTAIPEHYLVEKEIRNEGTEDEVEIAYLINESEKIKYTVTAEIVGSHGTILSNGETYIIEEISQGKDQQNVISFKPDDGYRVSSIWLYQGEEVDGDYDETDGTEINDYTEDYKTAEVTMPIFTNVSENKHFVVKFETRPVVAKIISVADGQESVTNAKGQTILNREYFTLKEALEDAELIDSSSENVQIKILNNIQNEAITIVDNNNITIDLNGKTINSTTPNNEEAGVTVKNSKLKVIDSTENKEGKINTTAKYGIYITTDGEVTLGEDDEVISDLGPTIEANLVGLFNNKNEITNKEGIFNFYDGKLIGKVGISGTVTETPVLYEPSSPTIDGRQVTTLKIPNNKEARIGRKNYIRLEDAINAAGTMQTSENDQIEIVILKDLQKASRVIVDKDKNVKIDLDGHTITSTSTNPDYVFENRGKLEIVDSSANEDNKYGEGKITNLKNDVILNSYSGGATIHEYDFEEFNLTAVQASRRFKIKDGKLVAENIGRNTTANCYLHIDLRNMTGEYALDVNAKVSSQEGADAGYAIVTNSTSIPSYSTIAKKFIDISGEQSAKDYFTVLYGGKDYYIHFGYKKDSSIDEGDDTFTINSINLYEKKNAELTITSGTLSVSQGGVRGSNNSVIRNEGTLNIGKIETGDIMPYIYSPGPYTDLIDNTGNILINNGNMQIATASGSTTILNKNSMIINNGTIIGGDSTVLMDENSVTATTNQINGGTINGKVINNSNNKLVITNGDIKNTISANSSSQKPIIQIDGGIFNNTVTCGKNGELIINEGTFNSTVSSTDSTAKATVNNGTFNSTINAFGGEFNFKGGNIAAKDGYGISSSTGTLNVSGGKVESTNKYGIYINNGGKVNISGGEIYSNKSNAIYFDSTGSLSVTGGTLKTDAEKECIYTDSKSNIVIGDNSNSISTESPEIIALNGTGILNAGTGTLYFYDGVIKAKKNQTIIGEVTEIPDGVDIIISYEGANNQTEVATLGIEELPVARIGEQTYTTLQSAINACPDNSAEKTTIEILKDINISKITEIPENKNAVIDMHGFDFKLMTKSAKIINNGNIEITDKTVTSTSVDLTTKVNSTIGFENTQTGALVSINKAHNKTSNAYIPLDLTAYSGKDVEICVNADISSQSNADFGYATITQTRTVPSYSATAGRFMYISGEYRNSEYTTTVEGGKMYYLHFGYRKDGNTSTGSDTLTINSVKIRNKDSKITSASQIFENNGTLTLGDVNIISSVIGSLNNYNSVINNVGELIINGATITSSKEYVYIVNNDNSGTVTMNNGKISTSVLRTYGIYSNSTNNIVVNNGTIEASNGIYNINSGTVTMNSGTIEGRDTGIYSKNSSISVKDCNIYTYKNAYESSTIGTETATININNAYIGGNGSSSAGIRITGAGTAIVDSTIIKGENGIMNSQNGNVTFTNGSISSTTAITNEGTVNCSGVTMVNSGVSIKNNKGTISLTDTNITSKGTNAIENKATLNFVSGSAENIGTTTNATSFNGIYNYSGAILNLGTEDGDASTTNPSIKGYNYGIKNEGTFNFFDGIIEGKAGKSIDGEISKQETGYEIIKTDLENSRESKHLGMSEIAINTTTNKKYYTIQEAVDECVNGETIQIIRDAVITKTTDSVNILSSKEIIIDIAGHTISAGNKDTFVNEGMFTLTNSETTGYIENTSYPLINNKGTGNVEITNVTVNETAETYTEDEQTYFAYGIINNSTGTVTVTNSSMNGFYGINNASTGNIIIQSGTIIDEECVGINNETTGIITVNAGDVKGKKGNRRETYGIQNNTGTVNINGGTVEGRVGIINLGNGIINIHGGTIKGDFIYGLGADATYHNGQGIYMQAGYLYVDGGTISATGNQHAIVSRANAETYISNGTLTEGIYGFKNTKIDISGGTIQNKSKDTAVENYGSLTISGGELSTTYAGNNSIGVDSNIKSYALILNRSSATAEITGGTLTGRYSAISNAGSMNISGGTLNVTENSGTMIHNAGTMNITGVNASTTVENSRGIWNEANLELGTNNETIDNENIIINAAKIGVDNRGLEQVFNYYDGVISAENAIKGEVTNIPDNKRIDISGTSKETATIGNNYEFVQVGGTNYDNLQNAINAIAENNIEDTVTVTRNCVLTNKDLATISANRNVILDLNGNTVKNYGKLFTNNGTVKIIDGLSGENGIITGDSITLIENNANLEISANITQDRNYRMIDNSTTGKLKITKGNIIVNDDNAYYNNTVVNNVGNGSVEVTNGNIQFSRKDRSSYFVYTSGGNTSNPSEVKISGGNISTSGENSYIIYAYSRTEVDITGGTLTAYYPIYARNSNIEVSNVNIIAECSDTGKSAIDIGSATTMTMTSGTLTTSGARGIAISGSSTKATILGGEISTQSGYGIYIASSGKLILGDGKAPIKVDSPTITSNTYGVYKDSGTFSFFDGTITGNTKAFNQNPNSIPDDSRIVLEEDGKVAKLEVIGSFSAVAKVNGTSYENLQDAITAIIEGTSGTVEIQSDIALTSSVIIEQGQVVTIDLRNCSINSALSGATIVNNGTLTIIDSERDGATELDLGTISNSTGSVIENNGTLIIGIDDGTVNANSPIINGGTTAVVNNGTMNLYDGKLIDSNGETVAQNSVPGASTNSVSNQLNAFGKKNLMARNLSNGLVGNSVNGVDEESGLVKDTDEIDEINGNETNGLDNSSNNELENNSNNTLEYKVKVAEINENYYESLAEAIESAENDSTIKLLEDINLSEKIDISANKNLTIDLNGNSINSALDLTIDNNGNLLITGVGFIKNSKPNSTIISNKGTLRIEKCIINSNSDGVTGISNLSGNTKLLGGKIILEGKNSIGINNNQDSTLHFWGGIIEMRKQSSKSIVNKGNLFIGESIESSNIPKIVVADDDSIGIVNLDSAKKCEIKLVQITLEADVIENYELIKNTNEFKAELDKMKSSYGIFNEGKSNITMESGVINVERLKGVGILNNSSGSIILGNKDDGEVNTARPTIYAIKDHTTAIINSSNGNIYFYDGRFCTFETVKNAINNVLENYVLSEEGGSDVINTILKAVER